MHVPYGIWGGLTENERRHLRNARRLRRLHAVSHAVDWVLVYQLIGGLPVEVPADMLTDTVLALHEAGERPDRIARAVKAPYPYVAQVLGLAA